MTEDEKVLLEALETLLENGPDQEMNGICLYLERYPSRVEEAFYSLTCQWPEFTGITSFPIPHPSLSPIDAYMLSDEGTMWSREHPYGAARWRLVEWCIEKLKEKA